MKKMYSEQELREILGQNLPDSDLIDQKIQEAYIMIRKTQPRRTPFYQTGIAMTAVAAALILCFVFLAANPVLAARIPIIGRIFQMEEEKVSYPGDYSTKAQTLIQPEENGTDSGKDTAEQSLYSKTSGGVTFSISQCYADSMSMYLAVSLEAENGFPQKLLDVSRDTSLAWQNLQMETTAVADFGAASPGKLSFDPGLGVESPYTIEGHFLDDSTFAGIIRIDLANMTGMDADGRIQKVSTLPDRFTYDLNVTGLYVPLPETHSYSNDPVELEMVSGDWSFSIDVNVDNSETITKEVNLTNENGLGIAAVRRSPYEITADLILPEGENQGGYVVVMADAAGEPLDSRGGYMGLFNTWQRDVSSVTVAICTEETFMNDKGDFGTLLSKALFKTEVSF